MEIGIIISLAIGVVAIYIDLKNKANTYKSQLERLSVSTATFVRRCQVMESVMTGQHKKAVSEHLKKNEETLPKIAVRETWRKIKTGKK